ncbi:MAG: response regulator [Cyclobacteriaceae bacterium]|nr:response regulator [Cyclobacteriaceae bacterium]MDX5467515.1 response regulator [Cyclobacteriaceae bacterium]
MPVHPIRIFLIEDNEGDFILIKEGLEEAKIPHVLTWSKDGADGIDLLQQTAIENPKGLPDLIILDINLPKKNGHEVLDILKKDSLLRIIPIIVLTTSTSELDIFKAYDLHANCYIGKPIEIGDFLQVIRRIEEFWISMVKLPKNPSYEKG